MSKVEDGGSAFPVPGLSNLPNEQFIYPEGGMSLRDYFAAKAMQGMLAGSRDGEPHLYYNPPAHKGGPAPANWAFACRDDATVWAENAYKLADAMLEARKK